MGLARLFLLVDQESGTSEPVTQPIVPQPTAHESQEDYVVRAHTVLLQAIPEPADRNAAVWNAWDRARGFAARDLAARLYSADQYDSVADVCLFAEHDAPKRLPDGTETVTRYDAQKLSEIIRENNFRIEDTDTYPGLVDKHTVPAPQRDPLPPKTLGYVGPFRLGMIGRRDPRWAVFGDEHRRKEAAAVLSERPRRSVEVLTLKANGRTYIDPVAAISEAPRLALPVQYSAEESGEVEIERYSALSPVPAAPGGMNTYIQRFDAGQPDPAAAPVNPQGNPQGNPMATDQDVRQVIDAIMQTPAMQGLAALMQAFGNDPQAIISAIQGGGGQQPGQGGAADTGQGAAGGMQYQPGGGLPAGGQPMPGTGGMGVPDPAMRQDYSAARRYAATASNDENEEGDEFYVDLDQYTAEGGAVDVERYAALEAGMVELSGKYSAAMEEIARLQCDASDARRREQLRELAARFPVVDAAAEFDRCLYSAGAEMTDAQFAAHIGTIEQYAAKAMQVTQMVPAGELPGHQTDVETARYQADEARMVRTVINEAANAGRKISYPQARKEARERLGV